MQSNMAGQPLAVAPITQNDNTAMRLGFTRAVMVSDGMTDLYLLVRPDTDFDDEFKAFDTDNQEWLRVKGWQITDIEELG